MALQCAISFAACAVLACAVAVVAFHSSESVAGWAFLHVEWSCVGLGGSIGNEAYQVRIEVGDVEKNC